MRWNGWFILLLFTVPVASCLGQDTLWLDLEGRMSTREFSVGFRVFEQDSDSLFTVIDHTYGGPAYVSMEGMTTAPHTTELEGPTIWYYQDGSIRTEGEFREGKRDGIWQSYYTNDTLAEVMNFMEGLPDGDVRGWHPNGEARFEGVYHLGLRTGNWRWWHDNGVLEAEVEYHSGRVVGPFARYDKNGATWIKGAYSAHGKEGTWRYYMGGEELGTLHYDHGKPTGKWVLKGLDPGRVAFEGRFKDGQRTGLWKWWLEGMQCEHQEFWKGGSVEWHRVCGEAGLGTKTKGTGTLYPQPIEDFEEELGNFLKDYLPEGHSGSLIVSLGINRHGITDWVQVCGPQLSTQASALEDRIKKFRGWKRGTYVGAPANYFTDLPIQYFEDGSLVVGDHRWLVDQSLLCFPTVPPVIHLRGYYPYFAQEVPEFPGGEIALFRYIGAQIRYPEEAREVGTEGLVRVAFTITRTGLVTDATIIESPHPLLSKEALRVVEGMPFWSAGLWDGHQAEARLSIPIRFSLQ